MSGRIDKELRPLAKELRRLGCVIEGPRNGNNHSKVFYEDRYVGSLSSSSGSVFVVRDAVKQLREHGVPIRSEWPRARGADRR